MELFGEGLGDVVLLKDICHWEWALRFHKPILGLSLTLPTICGSELRFQLRLPQLLCLSIVMLPAMMVMDLSSETVSKPPS